MAAVKAVKAYTARAHREGKWWVVHVPEIDKTTQVRRLDQVDEYVRDLIGLFTKDNPSSVEVRREFELPSHVNEALDEARRLRENAETETAKARMLVVRTARDLADRGLSVRDIGTVLGVSFQRAQQLLADAAVTKKTSPGERRIKKAAPKKRTRVSASR
ncbi:MAG: hypothetical protein QOG53_2659 [Frankiales bacterium]|jgi:hypothetical protein|nr:hypothetical protein [Frankiales bacterium]